MSALAFFPWYQSESALQVDEFHLVPFARGEKPSGPNTNDQEAIDSVLRLYRSHHEPISSATILHLDGRVLTDDLSDTDVNVLFSFSELVAFSGLSAREFFHWNYWNRDNFRLIIQAFKHPQGGVAVPSRRRDGNTISYMLEGSYNVALPSHVHLPVNIALDQALLKCLTGIRTDSKWFDLLEAITNFNLANTDSSEVQEHAEAILMIGAYERALGCRSGKEKELATKLLELCPPAYSIAPVDCPRQSNDHQVTREFHKKKTVCEGWIRDFFRLRGEVAHGQLDPKRSSIWSLREHLLLGAYLFPFVVKGLLAQAGKYAITDEDQGGLNAFEALACTTMFDPKRDESAVNPWRVIRQESHFSALFDRRSTVPSDT